MANTESAPNAAVRPRGRHESEETLQMTTSPADVMKMIKDNEVKFVDFRFTDTRGKEQHVTVPV